MAMSTFNMIENNIRNINNVPVQQHQTNELPDTQTQTQGGSLSWMNLESQPGEKPIWGRLYGKKLKIKSLGTTRRKTYITTEKITKTFDLCNEIFTVGRDTNLSDILLNSEVLVPGVLNRISKLHFKIVRDTTDLTKPAYIEDCSRNGTFINGECIGYTKRRILMNNDVISVFHGDLKFVWYSDLSPPANVPGLPTAILKNYFIGKFLGHGACGIVHLIYDRRTCKNYALKFIQKSHINSILLDGGGGAGAGGNAPQNIVGGQQRPLQPKLAAAIQRGLIDRERIKNEVRIMKNLQHPCVIKMHDVIDTNESVSIILEYMHGGDLLKRIIKKQGELGEPLAKLYFYQLCLGVKHLHDQNVTHRDIKPDNILLKEDMDETLLKLSDFGLSKLIDSETVMRTVCGTKAYTAPEIFSTKGAYTKKVDIWSLGVVLFVMLCGNLPFSENGERPIADQIINARVSFKSIRWRRVSVTAKSLLFTIFTINPQKRPSIDDILKSEWLMDETVHRKFHEIKLRCAAADIDDDAAIGLAKHLVEENPVEVLQEKPPQQQESQEQPPLDEPVMEENQIDNNNNNNKEINNDNIENNSSIREPPVKRRRLNVTGGSRRRGRSQPSR